MINAIKKIVPTKTKRAINSALFRKKILLPPGKRSFIFLVADYGNIGDLAITAAQTMYLQKYARSDQVIPIPISRTAALIDSVCAQATPNDLITIVGGGNMGSLYPDIEELRQLVIRTFPRNRIVCFPQTLDWNNSAESRRALERMVRIYSQHPDLHVFARESVSREKLDALFLSQTNVRIGYAPDIVLSATAPSLCSTAAADPHGILLCLRGDLERAIDSEERTKLEGMLACTGHPIEFTDTHAGGSRLDEGHREQLLVDKLNEFRAARLVVTDRLHGMILSVVAGTPCLALPNTNHKIYQTWQNWLSDLPQVKFVALDDIAELPQSLESLLAAPRRDPALPPVAPCHYESLRKAVLRS